MLLELRKRTFRGKPIKEITVQKHLVAVSAVLSDAKRNEIITRNPARMVDVPPVEKAEQMQFYEGRTLAPDAHLFRKANTDLPMSPNTFTHWFKKMLQENALPTGLNIHSLRHSVASLLIADGTDVATVSSLLGHAQVSTTLDIYAHAFDSNKKAASEQLQRGLGV